MWIGLSAGARGGALRDFALTPGQYSKLEFTEQRFVWIKRELQYYEKHYDSMNLIEFLFHSRPRDKD